MRRVFQCFLVLFVSLFALTVPLDYYYLPDTGYFTYPLFKVLIEWVGNHVFGLQGDYTVELLSDSIGMYIHALNIAVISLIGAIVWGLVAKDESRLQKIWYWFMLVASYYLALQLFRYGFDKIFKTQFYLPEPNTLYTPLGHLSRDILYWSTIGSSYSYSVFAGVLEVIPAILLLFGRTRVIGAMIAVGVMINVVMINMGFDISVKVFSLFLLLISCILAFPGFKKLYEIFILKREARVEDCQPLLETTSKKVVYHSANALVIGLIIFESFYVYPRTGIFNDDKAPRPLLHGAYEVVSSNAVVPIKRVFVHRRGYFIFQFENDEMEDYSLNYSFADKQLILTDYDDTVITLDCTYSEDDSLLTLRGNLAGVETELQAKKLDWTQLPLMQKDFHWTIDGYE